MADTDREKGNGDLIPGRDPDPGSRVEKHVKVGWALVGVLTTGGALAFVLQRFGLVILPPNPQIADYARLAAFLASCLNILGWMWFPLEDMEVLRFWVHTGAKILPCHTAEFLAIITATVLLLLLILGSLAGSLWFAIAGTAVYLWNLVGFEYVRRQVGDATKDSRSLYGKQPEPRRAALLKALDTVENHWSCRSHDPVLTNKQQLRHGLLALSFAVAALLAAVAKSRGLQPLSTLSYIIGTATIIAAEASIAVWRSERDRALTQAQEVLRDLHQ